MPPQRRATHPISTITPISANPESADTMIHKTSPAGLSHSPAVLRHTGMGESNRPQVVSREAWTAARKELLTSEKEALRAKDALNTRRRLLPMVKISKDYWFEGPDGLVRLIDLFDGADQLVVQHFMFHPDWTDGCGSCTAAVDEFSDGLHRHLRARSTEYAVVARA